MRSLFFDVTRSPRHYITFFGVQAVSYISLHFYSAPSPPRFPPHHAPLHSLSCPFVLNSTLVLPLSPALLCIPSGASIRLPLNLPSLPVLISARALLARTHSSARSSHSVSHYLARSSSLHAKHRSVTQHVTPIPTCMTTRRTTLTTTTLRNHLPRPRPAAPLQSHKMPSILTIRSLL